DGLLPRWAALHREGRGRHLPLRWLHRSWPGLRDGRGRARECAGPHWIASRCGAVRPRPHLARSRSGISGRAADHDVSESLGSAVLGDAAVPLRQEAAEVSFMRRILITLTLAAGFALGASAALATGQPNQSCEDQPNT